MTPSRAYMIRLGESILSKKQVRLAKRLSEVEEGSDEAEALREEIVETWGGQSGVNTLILASDYRAQREEQENDAT